MKTLFQHRFLSSIALTLLGAVVLVLFAGQLDLRILFVLLVTSLVVLSYPSLAERLWQSRALPPDTLHIPVQRLRKSNEVDLLAIFDLPQIYSIIKSRYKLKFGDSTAPGIFLYIYMPSAVYELRNAGPETIYKHLAERIKADLSDPTDLDLIAQRNLPLTFGFRFLPKIGYRYHELGRVISIVKKEYFRENTRIRGVLQSRKRLFRMHLPEDSEWRTFQPYIEDSALLYGGGSLAHDFRNDSNRKLTLGQTSRIDAEKVEYPDRIPFGSLLTYAKKGEIFLQGKNEAIDKLYIDRINVLVNGTEHRKSILSEISKKLNREVSEEDFYPLFNYGQKLLGYLEAGKNISDFVSSHGNFALYYDTEKGWTILKLEPRLELRLVEAYWGEGPKNVNGALSLTSSRATLISGGPDSLLEFQISTGTPTRGQIFAADEMIESKIKSFSQIHGFKLIRPVGSGAEGCLYLAAKNSRYFFLKSPDGNLVQEEISTIESLKKANLIPAGIRTYPEERMIVLPEFPSLPENGINLTANKLIFDYVKSIWDSGFVCLDMTPDHVRLEPESKKLFLIDFSGYAELSRFQKNAKEFAADRKKIEYRTPEEFVRDFRDVEKLQIYLAGLLFYQLLSEGHGLPLALKSISEGAAEYDKQLTEDLKKFKPAEASILQAMLAYDPKQRKSLQELQFPVTTQEIESFWQKLNS
ncbi:serine/threonine-protein kinase [bacterium]|nr:serine/threonine-protein kinase [bacterium]